MPFMNNKLLTQFNDDWIISLRPSKNTVTPWKPYDFLVEKERTIDNKVEDIATIFLTNRECPFRCLMCDLWKNTTDRPIPVGAIPAQIQWALERLPPVLHIKLYNSGSFFDNQAIPGNDFPQIAQQLNSFKTVIVESHPRLVNNRCLEFQILLKSQLQVAMGLETVHPGVLEKLNKNMTLHDFQRATQFLIKNNIPIRAFILFYPPFLNESEGIKWTKRSIDFAFDIGVECCVIIPTRTGNGALEHLQEEGLFFSPRLELLEEVFEYGIQLKSGRMIVDLWDIKKLSNCELCSTRRIQKIHEMNLYQVIIPPIYCSCRNSNI